MIGFKTTIVTSNNNVAPSILGLVFAGIGVGTGGGEGALCEGIDN